MFTKEELDLASRISDQMTKSAFEPVPDLGRVTGNLTAGFGEGFGGYPKFNRAPKFTFPGRKPLGFVDSLKSTGRGIGHIVGSGAKNFGFGSGEGPGMAENALYKGLSYIPGNPLNVGHRSWGEVVGQPWNRFKQDINRETNFERDPYSTAGGKDPTAIGKYMGRQIYHTFLEPGAPWEGAP